MVNWVEFLQAIVAESDLIALKHFHSARLQTQIKKDMTPVSEADLAIEDHIRQLVAKHHPELSIMGEEYGETKTDSGIKLIIDPIDGTKNFIAGIPFFATLLAIEEQGKVVAGMVSAPATQDKWWAECGKGAYHNGEAIHVSKVDQLAQSLALHGSLYGSEAAKNAQPLLNLLSKTYRQRGFGDYLSPMIVASGAAEFAVDFNLKPWDMAPVKILIEEAGGKFTNLNGEDTIYSGNFIVSNGILHDTILNSVKGMS